jgi:hypothetical protein
MLDSSLLPDDMEGGKAGQLVDRRLDRVSAWEERLVTPGKGAMPKYLLARMRQLAAAGVLLILVSGCSSEQQGAPESAESATHLRADQWPTGAGIGPWREVGPEYLTLEPWIEESEAAIASLVGSGYGFDFPDGTAFHAYAAGGLRRGDDDIAGPRAAADQYVSELPNDAAAKALADSFVREVSAGSGGFDAHELRKYPSLEVADGVRLLGIFAKYTDGRPVATLYAIGRSGRLVSIEVMRSAHMQQDAPRVEFEATVRAAMERLTATGDR